EDDRRRLPRGQVAAAQLDGRRGHQVGGEHPGGGDRPVIGGGDQRQVEGAGGLDPGRDAGGDEPPGGGHAHGTSPTVGSASVSGRPRSRLAFWSAWPEAPLTRLSSAAMARTVSVRVSKRTVTWTALPPAVALVAGGWSRTATNGSPA